jgi:hypothetical protein
LLRVEHPQGRGKTVLLIRVCVLLVALFLCLGSSAWAERGVNIEGRAFADCPKLREIIIPASVLTVDDTALEGCADVTVYGVTGSEAQRFAEANGFRFVDPDTPTNEPDGSIKLPPVELPFVPKK